MGRRMGWAFGLAAMLVGAAWAGAKPRPAAKAGPGKAEAKKPAVEIEAYYPLNKDHKYIAEYLQKLAKAHAGQVSVKIFDMQTSEGRKAWSKTGLTCAGVFVNGKTKWEIKRGKKTESVSFLKRMDIFWERKDFETVVNQLLEQAKKTKKR
jgi:hypothetical protein